MTKLIFQNLNTVMKMGGNKELIDEAIKISEQMFLTCKY